MLSCQDEHGRYRLGPAVVTDVELLKAALDHARALAEPALAGTGQVEAAQAAIAVLRPHLARVENRPFREGQLGGGLAQWAAAYRVDERVESVLVDAGLLVAKLCDLPRLESLPDALWAIDQALLACPRNEALTRAGMEIDAQLGNREQVFQCVAIDEHRPVVLAAMIEAGPGGLGDVEAKEPWTRSCGDGAGVDSASALAKRRG